MRGRVIWAWCSKEKVYTGTHILFIQLVQQIFNEYLLFARLLSGDKKSTKTDNSLFSWNIHSTELTFEQNLHGQVDVCSGR